MITAKQLYNYIDEIMPFSLMQSWDNSGLLVDSGALSDKILVCLDADDSSIDYAVANGFSLILSHHPVIFDEVKRIESTSVLHKIIKNGISVVCAHTNFDSYQYGTCFALKEFLQLKGRAQALEIGYIIDVETPVTIVELAQNIKQIVKNTVQYTVSKDKITRAFVVAGSAKGMYSEVLSCCANCVITGESDYHTMKDLQHMDIGTICIGHDVSENISLKILANLLKTQFNDVKVEIFTTKQLINTI